MAGRRRFRVQQGLLRPRPVPGPAIHRDPPPRRARDGCPGHLRRHRRLAEGPHRHPGTAPGQARSAATAGTRHDPADHPRNQAPPRRPHHPAPAPVACHPLGHMDPPSPGPLTMVPQTRQAARDTVGQDVRVCVDVAGCVRRDWRNRAGCGSVRLRGRRRWVAAGSQLLTATRRCAVTRQIWSWSLARRLFRLPAWAAAVAAAFVVGAVVGPIAASAQPGGPSQAGQAARVRRGPRCT